jgi:hypothetical protein
MSIPQTALLPAPERIERDLKDLARSHFGAGAPSVQVQWIKGAINSKHITPFPWKLSL